MRDYKMNPHRKFKNHNLDNALFMSTMFVIVIAFCGANILNTIHKKNIEKLKETKPLAQQYTLNQSDRIWFYKPDEIGWTRGEVVYTWGYYPEIHSKALNKTFQFHEVEWTTRYE